MATIGKNILDNLTTSMYSDSRVIYREYIQNACDQIDLAVKEGILNAGEGLVDIFIDAQRRNLSIRDNATGIRAASFEQDLGDIANSNKVMGENKGFRGIGRLCGLAYCRTVRFSTSYKGEGTKSVMTCDARKMREMLHETRKYTLDEIWEEIISYSSEPEEVGKHYFEVELLDINRENTDLLDEGRIRRYLSFVAPVPYSNKFMFRCKIYDHARDIGYRLDEYDIRIDGAQIFKEYTTNLKMQSAANLVNYDEIFNLEFKDFRDESGGLVAWMWVGLSCFKKQIPNVNQMRGLRVRSGNIQLGKDDALQGLFKESRGNYYYVGEVFAVSKELIPNSQRDYFIENETRVQFEDMLRVYFHESLHTLYHDANRVKNDYKRLQLCKEKQDEYMRKEEENGFIDENERTRLRTEVENEKKQAEDARRRLKKMENGSEDPSPITEVRKRIGQKFQASDLTGQAEEKRFEPPVMEKKSVYVTSTLSRLTRNERKIVSKILSIVTDVAPKDIAERIVARVVEEMR